ncbi:MAG TPA: 4Fe-4S dicluster domain-containing protein [Firmicutes bacterium]|nr:4Fe-4S dicluster domain-containing protein [Bacillota bacterium]
MFFDTQVQELKYKALKEVATLAWQDNLAKGLLGAAARIVPGPQPTMRCCIYKERAIMEERLRLAMGGDETNENVIEVINIACDECPVAGVHVTESCRGCIAHRCMNACPKNAITIVDHRAHIDQEKCIECGRCVSVCPYSAIVKSTRPCENACKVGAIHMGENKKATIDNDKCIACGACVYQCPFGAIADKSYILDCIRIIRESENNTKYQVFAIAAPSISSQFHNATVEQVAAGLKALGFFNVVEVALGADMVAWREAQELAEKKFLTSSCCPAFVQYIRKNFPDMAEHISHNLSPMGEIAKYIKRIHPGCKVVFVGPCTAKKAERQLERVKDLVDCVITFEELQALFDSKGIDLTQLKGEVLDNASYFGRVFARSGGLAVAVEEALKEHGITEDQFQLNAISCNGISECKAALLRASKNVLPNNFIEGMACENGCIGGAGCITHGPKSRADVDKYGHEAMEKTIRDSIEILNF